MIRDFALDPALLGSYANARYLLEKFGCEHGRLIAEFPRHWKAAVYAGLQCGPVERQRIVELLQRAGRRLFAPRPAAPYDPHRSWLDNARREHARAAFAAILARGAADPADPAVLDGDTLDEGDPRWRTERDRLVPRVAEQLAAAVAPLLRYARRVHFVDPYFRPDVADKYRPLVHYLAALRAGSRLAVAPAVHLHVAAERAPGNFEVACRRALPDHVPAGMTVTVHRWRVRPGGDEFHNRYVLTDRGGVEFGAGLGERDAARTDRLSLLGATVWADLLARYEGPAFAHDPDGPPLTIAGRR